jgi:ATPase
LADYLSQVKVNGKSSKVLILTDDSQNNVLLYAKRFKTEEQEIERLEKIDENLRYDLNYCLENEALSVINIKENIDFIPFSNAGLSNYANKNLAGWIEAVKEQYDFLVVDSNPSLQSLEFMKHCEYWIAPTEPTQASIEALYETVGYVGVDKLVALVPNKIRENNLHKNMENYIRTKVKDSLVKSGADPEFLVSNVIKTSTEYERLHFDGKTVTDLTAKGNEMQNELNYTFFRLAERIIEKMQKDNKETKYKFNEKTLLRNKKSIMEDEKMSYLSEFEEKYLK